jgi:hypothetical protein
MLTRLGTSGKQRLDPTGLNATFTFQSGVGW